MAFSKLNFITPVTQADKILRICNDSGVLKFIIRESTSTVKQQGPNLYVKQSSDSNPVVMDFADEAEAVEAQVLLRNALTLLGQNTGVDSTGNSGSGWNNNGTGGNKPDTCDDKHRFVLLSDIWTESDDIPNAAPVSTSGVVQKYVNLSMNYKSGTSYDHPQFVDIIPPDYGNGSYAIVLRTTAGVIIPPTMYTVDLGCGVITVNSFLSQGGLIVDQNSPPKVSFFKYIGSKGVFVFPPPPPVDAGKISNDFKNEHPVTTTMDGQLTGISGLYHKPVGAVMIEVNGVGAFVGNGCTHVTFYSPTWECLFVSDNIVTTGNTSNTISLDTPGSIVNGDYIIVRHNSNGQIDCFQVTSATSGTVTVNGTIIGSVSSVNKVRTYTTTDQGDKLTWFGSFAGYELDPTDRIMTKYLEES